VRPSRRSFELVSRVDLRYAVVPRRDKFSSRGQRLRVSDRNETNPVKGCILLALCDPYRVGRCVSVTRGRCPRLLNLSPRGRDRTTIEALAHSRARHTTANQVLVLFALFLGLGFLSLFGFLGCFGLVQTHLVRGSLLVLSLLALALALAAGFGGNRRVLSQALFFSLPGFGLFCQLCLVGIFRLFS
jgi:hypothetical protein